LGKFEINQNMGNVGKTNVVNLPISALKKKVFKFAQE
jgi:hypothetical protein